MSIALLSRPLIFGAIIFGLTIAGLVAEETQAADKEATEKLTTGPEDPREVVSPGAIDDDAATEFTKTESGLEYRVLRKGSGRPPATYNTVEVHYKGWLDDESIFDSSYRRGKSISFGLRQVIPGWTEGMQLVGRGGMIELQIPYQLAYGERGKPGSIPPKARLHFIVELIRVR